MPGWREVCDDCLTTIFNHHYMCAQCGYMTCIDCSKQYIQLSIEKRKSRTTKYSMVSSIECLF